MRLNRTFGVLLHPTALPGKHGIGDLGAEAHDFIDLLSDMGAGLWQILPLNPTAYGNSPYSADSVFAGNTLLIDLQELVNNNWIALKDSSFQPGQADQVDFKAVSEFKSRLLREAFQEFKRAHPEDAHKEFQSFIEAHSCWLADYALYRVCKSIQNEKPWFLWPDPLKYRHKTDIDKIRRENDDAIQFIYFQQYLFYHQWKKLKTKAREKGIRIVGDMPLFVALDSADVWVKPEIFQLNEHLKPINVAGVPPDYFSCTGQLWGNPVYDWEELRKNDYKWWQERFRLLLELVDVVRIDHFRGFQAYWAVSAHEETAINGSWKPGPGNHFFDTLNATMGHLPVIAEDLGVITPEVEKLRDDYNLPGMKILLFAFGGDAENPYLPHNHVRQSVVYTGTHDNDTILGWWDQLDEDTRNACLRQIEILQGHPVVDIRKDLLRIAFSSVSEWAVIPVQDIMGTGSSGRFNIPGTAENNWKWRLPHLNDLREHLPEIRFLAENFNRLNQPTY